MYICGKITLNDLRMKKHLFFILALFSLLPLEMDAKRKKVYDEKGQQIEKGMGAYLMVFFKDDSHSLYMATSPDGRVFPRGQPYETHLLGARPWSLWLP